jgi:hypothetical protein
VNLVVGSHKLAVCLLLCCSADVEVSIVVYFCKKRTQVFRELRGVVLIGENLELIYCVEVVTLGVHSKLCMGLVWLGAASEVDLPFGY